MGNEKEEEEEKLKERKKKMEDIFRNVGRNSIKKEYEKGNL